MGNFEFIKTPIDDLIVIEPKVFGDDRGYFMETYVEREFFNNGVAVNFVQDNQSRSRKGVLRGLHFQKENPQGKLVRCIEGEVFGTALSFPMKTENSFTYPKDLHTVFLRFRSMRHFVISVRDIMPLRMREVSCGTIPI